MGTTYHYANLTRREWFSTSAFGGSGKLNGLGLTLTGRTFELLLVGGYGKSAEPEPLATVAGRATRSRLSATAMTDGSGATSSSPTCTLT